jgi:UDP-N-acetylglucosamine--N-acetylmuramyl-(pentapeptide) pyrophosphoryl-undecaprenol N-acetylglucosamine transferase
VIHEQNAVAGTTNRWLARFATRVFEAFPDSFRPAPRHGVASAILCVARSRRCRRLPNAFAARGTAPLRLLVLGGSQGARVLNQTVPPALARLGRESAPGGPAPGRCRARGSGGRVCKRRRCGAHRHIHRRHG